MYNDYCSLFLIKAFTVPTFLPNYKDLAWRGTVKKESKGTSVFPLAYLRRQMQRKHPITLAHDGCQDMFMDWVTSALVPYHINCSLVFKCHDSQTGSDNT